MYRDFRLIPSKKNSENAMQECRLANTYSGLLNRCPANIWSSTVVLNLWYVYHWWYLSPPQAVLRGVSPPVC